MKNKIAKVLLAILIVCVMTATLLAVVGCGKSDLGKYNNTKHKDSYINVKDANTCTAKNFYYDDILVRYIGAESSELTYTKSGSTVYVELNAMTSYRGTFSNGTISFGSSNYKK